MALSAGSRIGPYEIVSAIGAGGMGEVYRARDTRLQRDVALKILPEAFASDPDRLARFEREAQMLASLNHPHIAAIHGFEESVGVRALVLELVEGETLADRIAQGAIPIDEAIALARQIADALEAAHEQGIIHRDLKPSNIKVRPDGTVKVLDFGLAKLAAGVSRAGATEHDSAYASTPFTVAPTITTPAMTQIGVIMGTAAYMSPEQAKGREADKRSDVWAFGAVLYEMLTAHRAFDGDDMSDTLASVLKIDPDWARLPAETPAAIRTLVQRCLAKDRRQRVSDIAAARFVLNELDSIPESRTFEGVNHFPIWSANGRVTFQSIRDGDASIWWQSPVGGVAERLTKAVKDEQHVPDSWSRDGTRMLFSIVKGGSRTLWVLTLNGLKIERFSTAESTEPLSAGFSPDGKWVVYSHGGGPLQSPDRGVFVEPYPAMPGGKRQAPKVNIDYHPVWSPDGTKIYYVPAATRPTMEVPIVLTPSVSFGAPVELPRMPRPSVFSGNARGYDVLRDGRVVSLAAGPEDSSAQGSAAEIRVMLN